MLAYVYDNEGYYIETVEFSKFEPVPNNALLTAPPTLTGTQVARKVGNSWEVLAEREVIEPTVAEQIKEIEDKIQLRLDTFAQSEDRFYDGIMSACTYANSTNPTWQAEGEYCIQARDNTWATAYSILQQYLNGQIAKPTWEDIEAQLPVLTWPTN